MGRCELERACLGEGVFGLKRDVGEFETTSKQVGILTFRRVSKELFWTFFSMWEAETTSLVVKAMTKQLVGHKVASGECW